MKKIYIIIISIFKTTYTKHIQVLLDWYFCRYLLRKGVETKKNYVKVFGKPSISKYPKSKIIIESGVTLISKTSNNYAGINHPVTLATLTTDAEIIIGKDSGLSGATICAASSVRIGVYVGIGANVSIYDTDFHPIDPYERRYEDYKTKSSPVLIDDYAWIGGNSIILKGVHIGKGSVVGAGSVVTKDVPDFEVHAGNPARFIKKITYNHETHHNLFDTCS